MLRHIESEAVDKTFQHGPAHFISPAPPMAFYIKALQYISQFFLRGYEFWTLDTTKMPTKSFSEALVTINPLIRRRIT
jgi:hypothetical protein